MLDTILSIVALEPPPEPVTFIRNRYQPFNPVKLKLSVVSPEPGYECVMRLATSVPLMSTEDAVSTGDEDVWVDQLMLYVELVIAKYPVVSEPGLSGLFNGEVSKLLPVIACPPVAIDVAAH